jgi:hypothetical protein
LALDELHARRLETVTTMVENALDRIELLLKELSEGREAAPAREITPDQIRNIRGQCQGIRARLRESAKRFAIHPHKPDARQRLNAELASLWVILENARPKRLKGYGREFAAADKADWEKLIQNLLEDFDSIRATLAG